LVVLYPSAIPPPNLMLAGLLQLVCVVCSRNPPVS
jgi:hypothetical protein